MTEEQRRYMHARNDFESFHVNKAKELLDATAALVATATRRAEETQKAMDELRPVWAHGWSTDSEAAQASSNALAQLWEMLGVDNQTTAVEELQKLIHLRDAGIPHDRA